MTAAFKITRRLGIKPTDRHTLCALHRTCPDVFELSNGDFAVIGKDVTEQLASSLPNDAGCGSDERIILLPRSVLVAARGDIPNT